MKRRLEKQKSRKLTTFLAEIIFEMVEKQKEFKIPAELVPLCPRCGKPMTTNLRKDNSFVEDSGWHKAMNRYSDFIKENKDKKTVCAKEIVEQSILVEDDISTVLKIL